MAKVAIILGSKSDIPYIEGCIKLFKDFEIPYEVIKRF
jgi:phosphoribosylcarboxyaminoimidazole (NCAIR) mutase